MVVLDRFREVVEAVDDALEEGDEMHQRDQRDELDAVLLALSGLGLHPVPDQNVEHNCVDHRGYVENIQHNCPHSVPLESLLILAANPAPQPRLAIGLSGKW